MLVRRQFQSNIGNYTNRKNNFFFVQRWWVRWLGGRSVGHVLLCLDCVVWNTVCWGKHFLQQTFATFVNVWAKAFGAYLLWSALCWLCSTGEKPDKHFKHVVCFQVAAWNRSICRLVQMCQLTTVPLLQSFGLKLVICLWRQMFPQKTQASLHCACCGFANLVGLLNYLLFSNRILDPCWYHFSSMSFQAFFASQKHAWVWGQARSLCQTKRRIWTWFSVWRVTPPSHPVLLLSRGAPQTCFPSVDAEKKIGFVSFFVCCLCDCVSNAKMTPFDNRSVSLNCCFKGSTHTPLSAANTRHRCELGLLVCSGCVLPLVPTVQRQKLAKPFDTRKCRALATSPAGARLSKRGTSSVCPSARVGRVSGCEEYWKGLAGIQLFGQTHIFHVGRTDRTLNVWWTKAICLSPKLWTKFWRGCTKKHFWTSVTYCVAADLFHECAILLVVSELHHCRIIFGCCTVEV